MKQIACLALLAGSLWAQSAGRESDGIGKSLGFLEGTWEAKTMGGGSAGATASGTYTFIQELGGHVLARHSSATGCKAPSDFNCEHRDLLYVYRETPGQLLKAISFDDEGHVIHYSVSTPASTTAIFISDPTAAGPQFRLAYELNGSVMSGKFQMRMPGAKEWMSYLEWSGARK